MSELRFADSHAPVLAAGDYSLEVSQAAAGANFQDAFTANTVVFTVRAPRFSLAADQVYSVFPPPDAFGAFDGVLPHILFTSNTLPWERSAQKVQPAGAVTHPWLALLLFTATEWASVVVSPVSVKDLGLPVESLQHADDPVQVIDVDLTLAQALCPRSTELRMLCHTRTSGASSRAVLVGPRAVLAEGSDQTFVACLVSVEGRFENFTSPTQLAATPPTATAGKIRFVLLHRWGFRCMAGRSDLHTALWQVMGAELAPDGPSEDGPTWVTKRTTRDLALRRPPDGVSDPAVLARLHDGFTAVTHHMRDGSRSAAWYRGPLIPYDIPVATKKVPFTVRSADELLSFDEDLGMFDVSYAAAWQLGRTLALADSEFASRLFRWKRKHRQDLVHAQEALEDVLRGLPLEHHMECLYEGDPEAEWLFTVSVPSRLSRLEGVPWRYLVADSALLPADRLPHDPARLAVGAFRVFVVDPWWMECLADGAFSIGRVLESDRAEDDRLKAEEVTIKGPGAFGCLLRGPFVQAWTELRVEAWVAKSAPAGTTRFEERHTRLTPTRLWRPAPDLLVALFQSPDAHTADIRPAAFDFLVPPETLHFGLDNENGVWTRKVRDPATGQLRMSGNNAVTVHVPFRDAARGVVDIEGLANLLGTRFSHAFALTVLDAPDRVRVHIRARS